MTRSKVKLQPFAKESERRVSFRKRKKGMVKKLDEITTLCDVEACAIISSPFDANMEVWPSHAGLHSVLSRFRNMAPTDQTKKMYNQETFTRERIQKLTEQLRKLHAENRRLELDQTINKCLATGTLDYQNNQQLLNDMDVAITQNLQEINMRIQTLRGENPVQEANAGGVQAGEGGMPGNLTMENITNVENFMAPGNGGGEDNVFPHGGAPGFM